MTTEAACSTLATLEQFRAAGCQCGCDLSDEEITEALEDSSDLVYALSGGTIFGECSATVRPQRNCWCGHCWGCNEIDVIPLRQPVIAVTQVIIDGVVIPDDEYALTARGGLYRLGVDGERPEDWPCCQKLYLPLTEVDTFGIDVSFGQESQPIWVRNAVIELACDMAGFWRTKRSRLPEKTTAITYQNVSVSLQDRAEALAEGRTEMTLPALSTFMSLVNPRGRMKSWIYAPDDQGAWTFPLS